MSKIKEADWKMAGKLPKPGPDDPPECWDLYKTIQWMIRTGDFTREDIRHVLFAVGAIDEAANATKH